ncbi:MAG: hypothetical protein D6770_02365 [Anaerolineae bacterium]|nr:MAG: hypothetical protein D6770_02365 [Anaerolineae bacterium]
MSRRLTRRFPLLIYERTINRWWPATLTLGLVLEGVGLFLFLRQRDAWRGGAVLGVGALTLLFTLFLLLIRRMAYVQPQPTHLRLVTPFLRLNISYKRFRRTVTAEMSAIFPPSARMSAWQRDLLAPLAHKTALIIELTSFPVPPFFLRLFLSPFFFKDRTPHLVILVDDWMAFSTALESLRSGGEQALKSPRKKRSILSGLRRE